MEIQIGDKIQVIARGVKFQFSNKINWVHITGEVTDKDGESINIKWMEESNINDILERTDNQLLPLIEKIKLSDLKYLDWDKTDILNDVTNLRDDNKTIYRFDEKTTRNKKIDILLR